MLKSATTDLEKAVKDRITSQGYTHFTIRLAWNESTGVKEFLFCRIQYHKGGGKDSDAHYDYGKFHLASKALDIKHSNTIMSELKNGYVLFDGQRIPRNDSGGAYEETFVPSGESWWIFDEDYPLLCIKAPTRGEISWEQLAAQPVIPYYSSNQDGINRFMNLGGNWSSKACVIVLPETRAKIAKLIITGKTLIIESQFSDKEVDFTAKFSCSKGKTIHESSPDISFSSGNAKYDCSFEPESAVVAMVRLNSKEMIDSKEFRGLNNLQRGIVVKTPESLITDMIEEGENKTIEFKLNIQGTDEFLESVVSFANTEGGTIIVGVADDKKVRGFHDDLDRAEKSIVSKVRSNCEPTIEPYIQRAEIGGQPILLVRVKEGDDKPYNMKDRGIFIRERDKDFIISRQQLDDLYSKKGHKP